MLELDLTDDWQVFDGQHDVTWFRRDLSLTGLIEGVVERLLSNREIEASGGRYQSNDVMVSIPAANIVAIPEPGDLIVMPDEPDYYEVISVDHATLDSRYRCVVRRAKISTVLDATVTILKDEGSQDALGAPVTKFVTVATNQRASIHPMDSTESEQQSRRMFGRAYRIVLDNPVEIGPENWIDDGSKKYRIIGLANRDTLGVLRVYEAVEVAA